jgi:hypothetical protein
MLPETQLSFPTGESCADYSKLWNFHEQIYTIIKENAKFCNFPGINSGKTTAKFRPGLHQSLIVMNKGRNIPDFGDFVFNEVFPPLQLQLKL